MSLPKNVTILGSAGLLGQRIATELSKYSDEELNLIPGRKTLNLASAIDVDLFSQSVSKITIINCAGITSQTTCACNQKRCRQVNALSPAQIARFAKYIVHFSTDAVFSTVSTYNYESSPTNPMSIYAEIKLESERLVSDANRNSLVLRTRFLGIGKPSGFLDFVGKSILEKRMIPGYINEHFNPVHVSTLSQYVAFALRHKLCGIRHFAGDYILSKYDFICRLVSLLGLPPKSTVQPCKSPSSHGQVSTALASIHPTPTTIDSTLNKTLELCAHDLEFFLRERTH